MDDVKFRRYRNLSHSSGVVSYAIGPDYILVKFKNGPTYTYNYEIPGRDFVEQMKERAQKGRGLSTFISEQVGSNFAQKN